MCSQARFAARLTAAHVKPATPGGSPVLFDSCETSCGGFDCPSFKGVAVRELARWLASPLAEKQPALKARPALLRSWANFQAPSETRMRHSAC